jgi:signal peptidase I
MHPTVSKGYYLVNRYVYHFSEPGRGDIVVLDRGDYSSDEEIKRVVGLPGETVQITSGAVYINGRRLDEPYVLGATYPNYGPNTMGKDAYFVLGDNRRAGDDSREYGPVRFTMIEGKIRPDVLFPLK